MSRYLYAILIFVLFGSCQSTNEQQFIFIGHSYNWKSNQGELIDPRIAALDLKQYEQVWLGGDLCGKSSAQNSTLEYLDSLLAISLPQTHWAIGNHDINDGNRQRISQFTTRPTFYSAQHETISILVLDTNYGHPQIKIQEDSITLCTQLNQQYQLLKNLCDTISQSTYLVVLHHHALLSNQLADEQVNVRDIFHYVLPTLPFGCTPEGSFQDLAYPHLKSVQQRGIQVILIGGDFGQRAKRFEYQNKDGIWFLGSGINNSMPLKYKPEYVTNTNPDSILIFDYSVGTKELTWEFVPLGGEEY